MTIISEETIIKYLSSTCSDSELADIHQWISESPDNAAMLFELERLTDLSATVADPRVIEDRKRRVLARIMRGITADEAFERASRRRRGLWIWGSAASVIIICVLASIFFLHPRSTDDMITIACADVPVDTVLPDGSHVWLNANTTLRYHKDFAENRELQLRGEAYFEVAHDSIHPFTVDGTHLDVTVLGTEFTFNSSTDGDISFVSLIQGSVKVKEACGDGCIVLSPGQKAIYDPADRKLTVHDAQTELDAVWHDNNIPFHNASIRDIARTLELIYDTKVHVSDKVDNTATYSGVTIRHDDIDTTITRLCNTLPIRFTIKNGEVYICRR